MTDRLKMTPPEDCTDVSIAMVAAKNPQAFVLHYLDGHLERWQLEQIKAQWDKIYHGTALAGAPVVILDKTFPKLEIVDLVPSDKSVTTENLVVTPPWVAGGLRMEIEKTVDPDHLRFRHNTVMVPVDSCISTGINALAEIQNTKEPYIGLDGDVR